MNIYDKVGLFITAGVLGIIATIGILMAAGIYRPIGFLTIMWILAGYFLFAYIVNLCEELHLVEE